MNYRKKNVDSIALVDTYRHKGLRQKLVNTLRRKGIRDEKVLRAIAIIPRHYMLDEAFAEWAYRDVAFPIEADQTISMPYTVALQSQLIQLRPGEKVLEIGTGSGYQASVLYQMGAKVYTIERHKRLFHQTNHLLKAMNYHGIRTLLGDGFLGAPRFAPFDKIVVTAGASTFPEELLKQLKPNGIMVLPYGPRDQQTMYRITKISDSSYKKENHGPCAFVPMLGGVV